MFSDLGHLLISPGSDAPRQANVERRFCTLITSNRQGQTRLPWLGFRGYTAVMADASPAARKLKLLRQRAGLSIREVAHALGMEHGSSYQHYEDRFRKAHLPLDLMRKLAPIFAKGGVEAAELLALAGVDARGAGPRRRRRRQHAAHRGARRARQRRCRARRRRGAHRRPMAGPDRDRARLQHRARGRTAHHHGHGRQHGTGAAAGTTRPRRHRRPPAQPARASSSSGTGSASS